VSQSTQQEVPEGYKQTEVGVIPEDWDVLPLGRLCSYQNGTAQESYFNKHGGYKIISIGNYSQNGKFVSTGTYIGHQHKSVIKKFILNKGELTMILNDKTSVGTIIGRVLLIDKSNEYVMNQRTMRLTPNGKVSSDFLFFLINSDLVHKSIVDLAKPGTQIYINTDDVTGLPLCFPIEPEEQTAIAEALSDVDGLIGSLERLIAKKRAIKTAAMQQLLTGKKRLPPFDQTHTGYKQTDLGEIPNDWEVKKLGDVFEITSSKRVFQSDWKNKGVPFYRARELAVLGDLGVIENDLFITSQMYDSFKTQYGVPKVGDMLVTGVGTLGKTYVVRNEKEFYFKDGNIIWFKMAGKVSADFVDQMFKSPIVKKQIENSSAGTTVGTYTITGANKTILPFPSSRKEQDLIGQLLADMDIDISGLLTRLDKTQQIKQGMMQELLTGRTRLVKSRGELRVRRKKAVDSSELRVESE